MTMTVEGPTSQVWTSTKDKRHHTETNKPPCKVLLTEDPHPTYMMGAEVLLLLGRCQANDSLLQASFGAPEPRHHPEGVLLKTKGAILLLLKTSQATGGQHHSLVGLEVQARLDIFQRAIQEVHQGITLTTAPVT